MLKLISRVLLFSLFLAVLTGCAILDDDPLDSDDGSPSYALSGNNNLWVLLGRDLKMDQYSDRPIVQEHIQWYMDHAKVLERGAEQASPYVYYVLQQVKRRHLPSELALIPLVESNYNPYAYSRDGAEGLWQMMPHTASDFSIHKNWWYDGRRDVYASTNAALDYFVYLHKFFNNDWLLAIAAYDAGQGTVANAMNYNARHGLPTDYWDLPLSNEARNYVPKLLALAIILSHPKQYPIQWPNTQFAPYLTPVPVGSQIDMALAAQLAGISVDEMYRLNPGYERWATDPSDNHYLMVPSDKAQTFEENLSQLPTTRRVSWRRYTVHNGDTLNGVAVRFGTSPLLIADINNLHTHHLTPGQTLLLPMQTQSFPGRIVTSIKQYFHHQHQLPAATHFEHVVSAGESLWSIAHRYHVTESNIQAWNHLSARTPLKPGMRLIIWTETEPESR